jgi:hypothetical protein
MEVLMFETELKFFIDNQAEFVRKYPGQFLVIVKSELVGAFPSALAAYEAAQAKYERGTFVIQPCVPGPAAYTIELSGAA